MPGSNQTYRAKTKQELANAAIQRARKTVMASRRGVVAPPRTGGFYGVGERPRGSGPELKAIDVQVAAGAMTTGATVVCLNGCQVGADIGNRIGRKLTMKSLMLRLNFSPIATTDSPVGCTARCMVVYDAQSNAATITGAMLLRSDAFLEPNNLENRDRFTVLMDKFITLPAANYTASEVLGGSPTPRLVKKYLRINRDTVYNTTNGGTFADITSGGLWFVVLASNTTQTIQLNSRLRFVDT